MGIRGPLPKSQRLRLLENDNADRKTAPNPKPNAPRKPLCPPWLCSTGKAEWKRVAPELYRLGLLTSLDVNSLANYCSSMATYKNMQRVLQAEGFLTDEEKTRPEFYIAQNALKEARQWGKLFGLSPACRARIELPEPSADELSEFESLLDG